MWKPDVRFRLIGGQWVQVSAPNGPDRPAFVITCRFGDWSGFRTLAQCLAQVPASWQDRPDGFYWIEER